MQDITRGNGRHQTPGELELLQELLPEAAERFIAMLTGEEHEHLRRIREVAADRAGDQQPLRPFKSKKRAGPNLPDTASQLRERRLYERLRRLCHPPPHKVQPVLGELALLRKLLAVPAARFIKKLSDGEASSGNKHGSEEDEASSGSESEEEDAAGSASDSEPPPPAPKRRRRT